MYGINVHPFISTHLAGIMYGINVPPAFGETCGRGVLTPPCNAATYVDTRLFGVSHMYYPANGGECACVCMRVCA